MFKVSYLAIALSSIIVILGLLISIHFISSKRSNYNESFANDVSENITNKNSDPSIYKNAVDKLKQAGKTVSTMESCTGGNIANSITNVEGASSVFQFGAVTYSNDYKIKMGVDSNIIEKYTVYSMETAKEMSLKISLYTGSDFGIGITGKLNRVDPENPFGDNNKVYISIYEKSEDKFYTEEAEAIFESRSENKEYLTEKAVSLLVNIL